MDNVKIPERFFKELKIKNSVPRWEDGERIVEGKDITFKGALFDLSHSDYIKFQSQDTTLGFEDRKLYVKENVEIDLKTEVIDHLGNKFRVVGKEDYRQNGHANLIICYLERLIDGIDREV